MGGGSHPFPLRLLSINHIFIFPPKMFKQYILIIILTGKYVFYIS